jgi:hypothetical protein
VASKRIQPQVLEIHTFQSIVTQLIREEAPELAPKLAERLRLIDQQQQAS